MHLGPSQTPMMKLSAKIEAIHPFHATELFRYPLETKKPKGFLMFSGGIERDQWHEMS